MLPQHIVVVPIYLEQRLEPVHCLPCRKYSLKITGSTEFLLRLEQDHPILGTEDL